MRGRDTLILLAILVLLGGYYFFFEIKGEKDEAVESSPPQTTDVFEELSVEDVTSFTVRNISGTVELRLSEGGTWQIEKPMPEEADHDKVQAAVTGVVQLSASRTLTEGLESLAVYGLAPPQAVLSMTLADGGEQTLFIGDKNPNDASYYVQRPEEAAIYLVSAYAIDQVKDFIGQPPVKPTPTPTFTPTPLVTPTVEVTATP